MLINLSRSMHARTVSFRIIIVRYNHRKSIKTIMARYKLQTIIKCISPFHCSRTAIKTNGYVTAITYGYPNASHINSNDQMTSVVSDCHQPWHGISCKVLKKLSNNIIPGSNVKLMELIGQGEFL